MGRFLLREYLPALPQKYAKVFLLGCTQPDKNPATYLKGSLRSQWMRGHNYGNSSRYMLRLARRLEAKETFTLWDYYSLGKLIHYTLDAFTYVHDKRFSGDLYLHHDYEVRLQNAFLSYLRSCKRPVTVSPISTAVFIRRMHARYSRVPMDVQTDITYAFLAACCLMHKLARSPEKAQPDTFPFSENHDILYWNINL